MQFISSREGILKKRYKRFFADVLTNNNETITVHCPNTGKMNGLTEINTPIIYSSINSKLKNQWQMAYIENTWVGINTMIPNRIFLEILRDNPWNLFKYDNNLEFYREYNTKNICGHNHRIDFLLDNVTLNIDLIKKKLLLPTNIKYNPKNPILVEVKHVHWRIGDTAYFPDCVTSRGTRQMNTFQHVSIEDYNILIVFIIQRNDCSDFSVHKKIDILFYNSWKNLINYGAVVMAIDCNLSKEKISYNKLLKVIDFKLDN